MPAIGSFAAMQMVMAVWNRVSIRWIRSPVVAGIGMSCATTAPLSEEEQPILGGCGVPDHQYHHQVIRDHPFS